jgi:hypothetical protein
MIRTLLGFDNKVEFDKAVRDAQKLLEYQRMTNFCRNILLPLLVVNDVEEEQEEVNTSAPTNHEQHKTLNHGNSDPKSTSASSSMSLWKQRVPDLAERVQVALKEPPSSYAVRDGTFPFRKLSTGRLYKGKTFDMIQDLFPYSYVVEAYTEASTPPSETEVLQAVVESRRPWFQSKSSYRTTTTTTNTKKDDSSQQLLQVALELCACRFPTSKEDSDELLESPCPTKSGQDCERACLAFLKEQAPPDHVVLQNVFVKAGTSSPKMKNDTTQDNNGSVRYHNHHNKKNSHHNLKRRRNGIVSGTIWTRVLRDNICSEFDMVIVDPGTKRVVEVWEAKRSISPSTLWDAMDRKLSAVQQLVKDKDAILEYDYSDNEDVVVVDIVGEKNNNNKHNHCNLDGNDKNPHSEMAELTRLATACMVDHDTHNHHHKDDHQNNSQDCDTAPHPKMVFGMFGMELLAPQNAVGQLEAIAAGKALSSSVETVLKAVQCGYVEIDRARLLFDIHVLRAKLQSQTQQFTIVLKIGNTQLS